MERRRLMSPKKDTKKTMEKPRANRILHITYIESRQHKELPSGTIAIWCRTRVASRLLLAQVGY